MSDDWVFDRTIFECITGSHAYGLATEHSDIDYRGVCIPPANYYYGLSTFEQKDKGWEVKADRVIFSLRKFAKLAADSNPNIIELMWVPTSLIIKDSVGWQMLLEHRGCFLTKKIRHTYGGYALSQLKRIKSHRKWLLNPPDHAPTREEYGLPGKKLSADFMGVLENLSGDTEKLESMKQELGVEFKKVFGLFEKERKWAAASKEWEQYSTWMKERNQVRAELEAKFGYDTKHACHLVRLLLQGIGALHTGELEVRLKDENLDLCMAVRAGAYSYEEVVELAEVKDKELKEAEITSTLPASVDVAKVNQLLIKVTSRYL